MDYRAPRLGQIEIPLTLISSDGEKHACACLNISSSGALINFLDDDLNVEVGMMFRSKMLHRGDLTDVWVQVERIAPEGVGVTFQPLET